MAAKKDEQDAPEEKDTKSKEKSAAVPPTVIAPVVMNNYTTRSDDDAVEGGWVDIVSGDYAGRFGSFRQALEHDPKTGYPTLIAVRTRDAENEFLAVDYGDVRPSARTGGR